MKVFIYILMLLSLVLVIYNSTMINFSDPFGEESIVAVITVVAGLCATLLLAILLISKRIETLSKKKKSHV